MQIQSNYSLADLTSFHLGGPADFFVEVNTLAELNEAIEFAKNKKLQILILGGASNLIVSDQGFRGLVIQINILGIEIIDRQENTVEVKVGAGEVWDQVVEWSVKAGYWGIENLSFVPGRTGAVPVQNVGCYGQEASEVVSKVDVLDIKTQELKTLSREELNFGYRTSRFNQESKNQFVILHVYFVLSKAPKPILNYVDLKKYMETAHKTTLTLNEIREALGEIRGYKFPDYKKMGNDGSCFKNLLLDDSEVRILDENMQKNFSADVFEKYQEIKKKFPVAGKVKMPVAFLVDICGLKGRKVGDAQLWDRQPLVIVNTTNRAKSSDVAELFRQVRQEVFAKTGMRLSSEPEWIGFTEHELNHYLKSHE